MKLDLTRVTLIALGISLPLFLDACRARNRAPEAAADPESRSAAAEPVAADAAPLAQEPMAQEPMAPAPTAEGRDFQEKVREAQLRSARNAFLVDRHVENAEHLLNTGALDGARMEVEAAREIAPADAKVLALRDRIAALMGEREGVLGASLQEIEQRETLRSQKARIDVEQSLARARDLLAMREYDRASAEVESALDVLRWSPYAVEWGTLPQEARSLRDRMRTEREAESERIRRQQEADATEKMRRQEAAVRAQRADAIAAKLVIATDAFNANDFEGARRVAEQVLRDDPRNERALEIVDASRVAKEEKRSDEFVRNRKQSFNALKREDLEARILYSEPYTLPSRDFWEAISALRDPNVNLDVLEGESEDTRAIRQMLATRSIPSLKLDGLTDIEEVVGYLRQATGIPMGVSPAAKDAVSSAGVTFQLELPHPVRVESALKLVLQIAPNLTYIVKDGLLLVTTVEQALGAPITLNHDVSDLIFGITPFQGPRIYNLTVPGNRSKLGGPSDENPFGASFDPVQQIPPEEITQLVRDTIAQGTWDQPGVSIEAYQGKMIVRHSIEVQRQVSRFLADLRRHTSALVSIEARFVTISENFLQVVGVDWRGLSNNFDDITNGLKDNASSALDNNGPGLPTGAGATPSAGGFFDNETDGSVLARTENLFDRPIGNKLTENGGLALQFTFLKGDQASMILRAVEKNLDVHEVNTQILSVANQQRSYITVINQQSYIADYDVEVAQASFIAEPKINILQSGVVLDVKPIINYNRKYITLELQPTVARVVALTDFTTTLGGLAGAVTFQLPQLAVQSAFTTAVVPDGGAVLIGGLKTLREIEARAEVPWLGRLPIVGFFFKKEGYDSENENLMILIRARIADAREEVKKLER